MSKWLYVMFVFVVLLLFHEVHIKYNYFLILPGNWDFEALLV